MSYPFGNCPTLHEYIGWCNQQGCTTHSAVHKLDGKILTSHTLVAKSGRHVIAVGSMTDRLLATIVAYYDRRLGLSSPYGKIGDGEVIA